MNQRKDKEKKSSQPKLIKRNGVTVGISIDATKRKNPKNIDEVFANIFSKYV